MVAGRRGPAWPQPPHLGAGRPAYRSPFAPSAVTGEALPTARFRVPHVARSLSPHFSTAAANPRAFTSSTSSGHASGGILVFGRRGAARTTTDARRSGTGTRRQVE